MSRLTGIRACVFDAYGTIFDFASAAARCPDIPEDKRGALTSMWRDKQLQYTWLRSLQGGYVDFWQVTGDALEFTLDSLGIATPALHERLMDLWEANSQLGGDRNLEKPISMVLPAIVGEFCSRC